jgi:outer membrane protein assembly factor BamD
VVISSGTAKKLNPEKVSADSLFMLGEDAYQKEEYRLAVSYLDYFVLNYPVRDEVSKAQYYLADSYFKLKQFSQASVEFEFLYKQFPSSGYTEEAMIRAAQATFEISEPYHREQVITLDAQRMAKRFLEEYPNSKHAPQARRLLQDVDEKLATKELQAAKLYYKFKEYQAAIMSLEYILAQYPNARKTNLETNYYLALCKAKTDDPEEAQAILEELADNPEWTKKAQKALEKLAKQQQ